VSSITGAGNPLVRGTDVIRAPFAAAPLVTATVLEFPRFGRLTTIWEDPKASEAGRFSADITMDTQFVTTDLKIVRRVFLSRIEHRLKAIE
jgi:hypothetical protein